MGGGGGEASCVNGGAGHGEMGRCREDTDFFVVDKS